MIDFNYWYTLYEYLDKYSFNGDIIYDAKIIAKTKCFWNIASNDFLKEINIEDLAEISCLKVQSFASYVDGYNEFLADLVYSSDRMCADRWLRLQNRIYLCYEMIYEEYKKNYNWITWWDRVLGGYVDKPYCIKYKINKECKDEWENTIKPLIIENQKGE